MPDTLDHHALSRLLHPLRVAPGSKVDLARDHDPGHTAGWLDKKEGKAYLRLGVELLAEYQGRLSAQERYGVLVVLQGLDAAGKDGVIRHVMSGVNPQGVTVHSFKVPSAEELGHDYLWRYDVHLPARGQIGIFNRSHYEEVLVVRVHPELLERRQLPPESLEGELWMRRYREINEWERHLVDNGIRIVKLFLNLSFEEQRKRFLKRIERSEKNWKFSAADISERGFWEDYQHAFSEMLSHTSTEWAPWHVIPADHKWFERIAAGAAIVEVLAAIDPQFPTPDPAARAQLADAGERLRAEAQTSSPGVSHP